MRIAVFGANGPTGREFTRIAVAEGHEVVAFTRRPDSFPIARPGVSVVGGDVEDPAAVAAAIDGTAAVVSTLGVPFAKHPIRVYSTGITNILAGMRAVDVKRIVAVSSSSIGPHDQPLGGFVIEKVVQPYLVNRLGRTLYDDMRAMEAILATADVDWTVVRPSGLFDAPAVSDYRVEREFVPHRFTARIDLADSLLRQATSDTYARSAIAVATPSASPSLLRLVWREGIRKKA